MAFADHLASSQRRSAQCAMLDPITDCLECQERDLENGETCSNCGNSYWKLTGDAPVAEVVDDEDYRGLTHVDSQFAFEVLQAQSTSAAISVG